MANFGVVPLLRLAALRLAPIFFTLFFLTMVVRFVQEAIKIPKFRFNIFVNGKVCQRISGFVKKLCKFYSTTAALLLISPLGLAQKSLNKPAMVWILGKGELREIPLKSKQRVEYSVGNKEVIKVKYLANHHTLAVKAKALGQTELILWYKKQGQKIQVYVISKKEQLQSAQLLHYLEGTGVKGELKGDHLWAKGMIHDRYELDRLIALKGFSKDKVFFQVTLASKLQNELRTEILEQFFTLGMPTARCNLKNFAELSCFTLQQKHPKEMVSFLKRRGIQLQSSQDQDFEKNFQIKLRLIQFSRVDGSDIGIGLEHFSGKVGELLRRPWEQILAANETHLSSINTEMNLLAEPVLMMNLGEKQEIKIGQEFPYIQNINNQGNSNTDWKFAGLKINMKLEKLTSKIKLSYQTSHSQWDGKFIQGNEGKGTLFIRPNNHAGQVMFQIPYHLSRKTMEKFPILGSIPLIGQLFQSPSMEIIKFQIWALVQIKEVPI